ncbi:Uma2 family endonuclease [Anthocerotibacter panamensis]|uniref:Uma2 family endonuclease n=1 Tax=Anthocerotibacter panamensis TaxID=2857077 RepID=UPI001C401560|nr:Uma2 family endonuclease [Anthocerotibacter panamensis]
MSLTARELEAKMPDATQLLSDEPEMESSLHYLQLMMLVSALEWLWRDRDDFFLGANLTVYFSRQFLKNRDFRGPDFFLVRDTEKRPRTSWVVWEEEGKYPDLIIELLSDSTAGVDRTVKKDLYQNLFRTPEYFWFSPYTLEFEGFRLLGNHYQPIAPTPEGWLWSEVLALFLGVQDNELRYINLDGITVPTPGEVAASEMAQAEAARQQAEAARQQAEAACQQAEAACQQAEAACQRAEVACQQAEVERQRAEQAEAGLKQAQESREAIQQRLEQLTEQLRLLGIEPDVASYEFPDS